MIRIQRSDDTTIILTLKELTTITDVEYLFEFIEEQSDEKIYAIIDDTSSYPDRYNEFLIKDGVTFTFPIDGYYTYNVYEQKDGTGTLDPTGLTRVEHGRAHVWKSDAAANEYTDTTEQDSIYE